MAARRRRRSTRRPRTGRRPGESSTRAEILDAARRMFAEHGYEGATMRGIAAEAGVDDFMAEAKPEDKLARIREEQAKGHLVAMTGDGTNDAPALAQADVAVAMNSGTQAAKRPGIWWTWTPTRPS